MWFEELEESCSLRGRFRYIVLESVFWIGVSGYKLGRIFVVLIVNASGETKILCLKKPEREQNISGRSKQLLTPYAT